MDTSLTIDRPRLRRDACTASRAYLPPAAQAVADLTPNACRWPIGEVADPGFRFCAAPRLRGSYCAAHRAISRGVGR